MTNGLQRALDHLRYTSIPNGLTDAQLLTRFTTERDEAAFAALVRRHGPMVMGVCRRILRDPHETEDAFQATFLVLVQKVRSLANRQALASWLHTVAYRTALEARARNLRRGRRERQVDVPHPQVAPTEPNDWQAVLDQELSRLPEKYRTAVVLCELEGRPRKEVARQLRLPEGTLSSRLAAARRLLAGRLARHGITLSGGALATLVSQAPAAVPTTLIMSTAKAALAVAAGQSGALLTTAAILSKGVIKAMFIAKLKGTLAPVFAVLMLGTGSLVYCAGGGSPSAKGQEKTRSPLEALRKENELLKINLRITLEKIQAMEVELKQLKGTRGPLESFSTRVGDLYPYTQALILDSQKLEAQDLLIQRAGKVKIDAATEIERALKALGDPDENVRKSALGQMERALKALRDERRPTSDPTPKTP
jgi:RNA polymerase sigma factor (sigma-70 family)